MNDRVLRQLVTALSTLAVLAVVLDAAAPLRVPIILVFAMVAPGLAATRFVPTMNGLDRIALAGAISLALNILASLLLVAVGRWSGEPVLATLVASTLVLTFLPSQSLRRRRMDHEQQRGNQEIRRRRQAQALAYDQVVAADPAERKAGLLALSWLLDDDGRSDEADRLRELARLDDPPQLSLHKPETVPEP